MPKQSFYRLFSTTKFLKNNITEDLNFLLKINLFQIILIFFCIIFILFTLFYLLRKKKITTYKNDPRIYKDQSNLSDFQTNDTAFDLSKIDLSLDKNSIEIADVKKSFTQEETISDSEAKSKLDLARAYIEMNNISSANEVISELINGASSTYKKLAVELSEQINK